jgi:hypothetical protein
MAVAATTRYLLAAAAALVAVLASMLTGLSLLSSAAAGPTVAVDGIPGDYLALYQKAATDTGLDWAILAAIGEVETDHGRVQGGACATSSAGARGPMQFMPATWANYGAGGDICSPVDAIPAAARYLAASGAPQDYHRAILAYNHAEWYVTRVLKQADAYRAAAKPAAGMVQVGAAGGDWLAPVPGAGVECDRRIVPDVIMLIRRWHLRVTACYAATGHKSAGEHPLGLAIDTVPDPPATWGMLESLARYAGWRPECASTGCAEQTHTAFRFVGWNGYPGHGDPAHVGAAAAHLHLSWSHGPGSPAATVNVLTGG